MSYIRTPDGSPPAVGSTEKSLSSARATTHGDRYGSRQCHQAQQARDPVRNREQGERGGTQVERPESEAKQRPAGQGELRAGSGGGGALRGTCGDQGQRNAASLQALLAG